MSTDTRCTAAAMQLSWEHLPPEFCLTLALSLSLLLPKPFINSLASFSEF